MDLTYSASEPPTAHCTGNYSTTGSIAVTSFTLDTGLTGFGTVTEAPTSQRKGAVDNDVVQSALEQSELLIIELGDEQLRDPPG